MTEATAISDGRVDLKALIEAAKAATPGPWRVAGAVHLYRPGKDGANICSVSEPRATTTVKYTEVKLGSEGSDEAFANATFIALANPSTVAAMAEELMAARAEIERLNRLATDRLYFMQAYEQMLGPTGLKVAAMWREKNVKRVHQSWGPQAHLLSGEERAQAILEVEEAMKTARRVDSVDSVDGHVDGGTGNV